MKRFYLWCDKYAKWIYLGLFIFVIPIGFLPAYKWDMFFFGHLSRENISVSLFDVMKQYQYLTGKYRILPLLKTVLLIISMSSILTTHLMFFLKKRCFFISLFSTINIVVLAWCIFDLQKSSVNGVQNVVTVHIAFYLYLLIFLFCLFMSVMQLVLKQPIQQKPPQKMED